MSVEQAATETEALRELAAFPLVQALFGRRSRRFASREEKPLNRNYLNSHLWRPALLSAGGRAGPDAR